MYELNKKLIMKLIIGATEILLLKDEYFEFHDGGRGQKFPLDSSILNIQGGLRAEELKSLFIAAHTLEYSQYSMDAIELIQRDNLTFELSFSISDFNPIIKKV
jgi:hypothetical protein